MFLLIQLFHYLTVSDTGHFTFHNVSINTGNDDGFGCGCGCFTFHNVSINTDVNSISTLISNIFTFHNVSINTEKEIENEE